MSTELSPIIGNWYENLDKGQPFVVVGLDEERELIEVQHYDGDVEEIEQSAWYDMNLEPAEAPEDWTGPMDDVATDDLDYSETQMQPGEWRTPLDEAHADRAEAWQEATPEEGRDERAEGDATDELYGTEPE